ncbi:hypothetical protein RGC27_08210, partial [Helicobacter pylori]|uniref:hypothetical protein n=1 Tax=Helicobacter pylori TaxID=210 RepID=UPI002927781A
VTLNSTTAALNWVRDDGKFIKNPLVNTKLRCRDFGVDKGGVLEEGTASTPIAAGVTCETAFICDRPLDVSVDKLLMGRGMIME